MRRVALTLAALALLIMAAPAPAATNRELLRKQAKQIRHLSRQLETAMNLIDAQDDRISELEHTARCTSWLAVDPASYLLPSPDAGAPPIWTTVLTQADDADGTYVLPISTNACLDGDD